MTNEEIYLRVHGDLPFMLKIIEYCDQQADSFASSMLHDRIVLERETVRVEEDRAIREQAERNAGHQAEVERRGDD